MARQIAPTGTIESLADTYGWVDLSGDPTRMAPSVIGNWPADQTTSYEKTVARGSQPALSGEWKYYRLDIKRNAGGHIVTVSAKFSDVSGRVIVQRSMPRRRGRTWEETIAAVLSAPTADDVYGALLDAGGEQTALDVFDIFRGWFGFSDNGNESVVAVTAPWPIDEIVHVLRENPHWIVKRVRHRTASGARIVQVSSRPYIELRPKIGRPAPSKIFCAAGLPFSTPAGLIMCIASVPTFGRTSAMTLSCSPDYFRENFQPYLDTYGPALREAFGVEPAIVSTGGNCPAMELTLEGGLVVWIADEIDPLSPWTWRLDANRPDDPNSVADFGFSATVHNDGPDMLGGATDEAATVTTATPEPAHLVALVQAAIDDARNGGINVYGPAGLAGDRIARGFNENGE